MLVTALSPVIGYDKASKIAHAMDNDLTLLIAVDAGRLKRSLHLLFGFLVGCVVAAAAVSTLGDWAWSFPVVLAAVAIAVR
jgi:Fumarase C C-terminus